MNKILVVGQTPPPYGGQAIMIRRLLEGTYDHAKLFHVRMAFSKDMDEMGKVKLGKLLHPIVIVLQSAYMRVRYNIKTLYYPPSGPDYLPVLRDIAILICIRWMFRKTIFHFHAAGVSELYARAPSWFRALYRWSCFDPDVAIRLSSFNPDDGAALRARRNYVIPNGIEDEYAVMLNRTKPVNSICNILFVGMVRESKGILVLVDAVKLVIDRGIPVCVAVVGKFESEAFKLVVLEKIAGYGLNDCFDFKGVLTGQSKCEQYLSADIFCFPTFFESESFGLVAVEAMQFRLPVIVSKWRGVQSLIQDGVEGFVVTPQDSGALAEKIAVLAVQPDLRSKMGLRARERFLHEYTIEKFYQRMDDCFANA